MELTGKKELGKRAERIIRQQLKREVVPPPPKPQVELCDKLRDKLEIETQDDGTQALRSFSFLLPSFPHWPCLPADQPKVPQ